MRDLIELWNERNLFEKIILLFGVGAALFHMYYLTLGVAEPIWFRALHLSFLLPIAFFVKRLGKKLFFVDVLLFLLSLISLSYIWYFEYERIVTRYVKMDPVFFVDIIMGLILIITLLEASRRFLGWPFTILTLLFFIYLFIGNKMPFGLETRSFSVGQIIEQIYLTSSGIFGITLGASATYVFLFIFFGSLLQRSGAGETFMELVKSLVGHKKGGPAKVAVLSSALMGTISGSPTANVVTTGTITIPMMRKTGFSKTYASAVEAAASTGGQIMPPVMGAAAFVLAEMVGIPYLDVAIAAAVPAFLYFFAIYLMVHFQASKLGLQETENRFFMVKTILLNNWNQFLPLIILIIMILGGYTAYFAATVSILSIPVFNFLRKHTRISLRDIILSMEDTVKGSIIVALATAAAGIIIGSINMSGLGTKFSGFIVDFAATSLFLSLFFTMIATILLGMGMPTTAAYITSTAINAPALVTLGIEPFSAHMFVFYYACLSSITPPVAIAAYAAAGLSGANSFKTGLLACRIGIVAFIIPYMFVFSDSLFLKGEIVDILLAVMTAILGVVLISMAFEGYVFDKIGYIQRAILFLLGLLAIYPDRLYSPVAAVVGLVILIVHYVKNRRIILAN